MYELGLYCVWKRSSVVSCCVFSVLLSGVLEGGVVFGVSEELGLRCFALDE